MGALRLEKSLLRRRLIAKPRQSSGNRFVVRCVVACRFVYRDGTLQIALPVEEISKEQGRDREVGRQFERLLQRFARMRRIAEQLRGDRKSTRLNSSHLGISYAVFCLKKKHTLCD